ncbi:MAG TPA: hypothetical protein VK619_18680 [Pyrinomonadaceae bacterium]|nr:hypothetical protein [Pyrinomonadaceae bacterium]
MAKSFLYRLFGAGKIPEHLAAQLKGEGILLLDEGVKGSVTYIDFRAPGRYSNWRRQWYTASIALTEVRLMGLRYSQTIIDVPLTDERIRSMQFSLEESDTLLVAFDPALFHKDWSGKIEYRFRTEQAQLFLDKLLERAV